MMGYAMEFCCARFQIQIYQAANRSPIAAGLLVERQKAEQRFVIDAVSAASQAAIAGNTSLQEKKGCLGSLLLICFLPAIFLVFALH